MNRISLFLIICALSLTCTSCAEPTASNSSSSRPTSSSDGAVLPGGVTTMDAEHVSSASSQSTSQPTPSTSQPTANSNAGQPAPPNATGATTAQKTEQVPAEVGVGKRGKGLDQFQKDPTQKIISTPAREYFRATERIIFDNVKYALQLYKGEHGQGPRSHEEFMREIIEANNIKLPELERGQRYIYNPETEELMVERPAPQ